MSRHSSPSLKSAGTKPVPALHHWTHFNASGGQKNKLFLGFLALFAMRDNCSKVRKFPKNGHTSTFTPFQNAMRSLISRASALGLG